MRLHVRIYPAVSPARYGPMLVLSCPFLPLQDMPTGCLRIDFRPSHPRLSMPAMQRLRSFSPTAATVEVGQEQSSVRRLENGRFLLTAFVNVLLMFHWQRTSPKSHDMRLLSPQQMVYVVSRVPQVKARQMTNFA